MMCDGISLVAWHPLPNTGLPFFECRFKIIGLSGHFRSVTYFVFTDLWSDHSGLTGCPRRFCDYIISPIKAHQQHTAGAITPVMRCLIRSAFDFLDRSDDFDTIIGTYWNLTVDGESAGGQKNGRHVSIFSHSCF